MRLFFARFGFIFLALTELGCAESDDPGAEESAPGGGLAGNASVGSTSTASGGSSASGGLSGSGGVGGSNSTSGGTASGGGGAGGTATGGGGTSSGGSDTGIGGFAPDGDPPNLTPGVWTNLTPEGVSLEGTFGVTVVEVDPNNTAVLYLSVDQQGMWKSVNAGATWAKVGNPAYTYTWNHQTEFLDSPIDVRVDPDDSQHLVATQGVRGSMLGFWVSTDGGSHWAMPPGFIDVMNTATNDVTNMAVDPANFDHILLSSHSGWANDTPAGILETTDGGQTFLKHAPGGGWGGSLGVNFLHAPNLGLGNEQTWLIGTDGDGFWRTTDSGETWTQVATFGAVHGGNRTLYFTQDGTVYAGANFQIARSTDQGLSWSLVGPKFSDGYYQVIGDGNFLYAQESNTGSSAVAEDQPYVTSPESDGVNWTAYQGGAQTFTDGPYTLRFDPVNRIIYSACWNAGLWALKVIDP